ncbi:hypothetical protein QVD17_25777 [Tagetes erecta]|uniref:Uncharacterized protein n=1 Tax=Tagetes erecta TaxID=13708 RepID=A0AAD8K5N2_TARER|nr:hypothetical protein QVD17_25777 [Tagetes erecta]
MLGLKSDQGDAFHDALDSHGIDEDDNNDDEDMSSVTGELTEILQDHMSTIDPAIQYKDVLLLFRFNDHDLPFELFVVTVVIGFCDLYKNIPLLKATAARLCGPFFGGLFKLASPTESTAGGYEVSMWRALWNDLFS